MVVLDKTTEATRKRYNRIAPLYDRLEGMMERSRYSYWRGLLWSKVEGENILEVGVGTRKNFPYYPKQIYVTAIAISDKMLEIAFRKAGQTKGRVHLLRMNVEHLEFPDNTFDTVVSTFVFCSVPHPVQGLSEIRRVLKPGGKALLIEHVLSASRIIAALQNLANPLVVRMMGANINRRTVENVAASGLIVKNITDLAGGIFKLIEARKE